MNQSLLPTFDPLKNSKTNKTFSSASLPSLKILKQKQTQSIQNQNKQKQQWIKVGYIPTTFYANFNNTPILVNENEFIMTMDINFDKYSHNGILGYNVKDNCWKYVIEYEKNVFKKLDVHACYYNPIKGEVYILGRDSKPGILMGVNLLNGKQTIYKKDENLNLELKPRMVFVNDYVHIACVFKNNIDELVHVAWNWKTNTIVKVAKIIKQPISGFGMIHLKQQNKLIIFGGFGVNPLDSFYSFDLTCFNELLNDDNINAFEWQCKWKQKQPMPKKLSYFGYTVSKHEKYLIVIGGDDGNNSTDIFLFNFMLNRWKQSQITMPSVSSSLYVSVSFVDESYFLFNFNDWLLLMDGLLRLKYSINDIYIPNDIITIIKKMYSNEYIHIMRPDNSDKEEDIENKSYHFKISFDLVLGNDV